MLRSHRERLAGIRPLKGVRNVSVPRLNEARDEDAQVLGGPDTGAAQALAAQEREPDLHLIEPRAMGGQPVEGDLGALGGAPVRDGLFLMITRIGLNRSAVGG